MPLIQVQVIKDVFSQEQKRQIISKLTDAMVSIEGENMRQVTLCLVEEVESGHCRRPRPGTWQGCVTARPRVASAAPGPLTVVRAPRGLVWRHLQISSVDKD